MDRQQNRILTQLRAAASRGVIYSVTYTPPPDYPAFDPGWCAYQVTLIKGDVLPLNENEAWAFLQGVDAVDRLCRVAAESGGPQ